MKKMILFVVLILTLTAGSVFARGGYLTELYESSGVYIKQVFIHRTGAITLILKKKVPLDLMNIQQEPRFTLERVHIPVDNTNQSHKTMLAVALTAFHTNKSIGMYASDARAIPFWGENIITYIVSELWLFES